MRISTLMIQQNLVNSLRGRLDAINKASLQVSTGQNFQTVSDDPIDATQVMRLDAQAAQIEQYRRNGTFATSKLSVEDTALSSLNDTLQQVKQLALTTTADNPSDPTRTAAVAEAQTLLQHVIALGNTQVGDQYTFGGDQNTSPPFRADGTYVGGTNVQHIDINNGVSIAVGHTGQPVITDAISAIKNLITQLQSGNSAQVQGSVAAVDDATQEALQAQSETGATMQDIQNTGDQLGAMSTQYINQRDNLLAADPTQSVIQVQAEQTALERAYAVTGIVIKTSILNYLQ